MKPSGLTAPRVSHFQWCCPAASEASGQAAAKPRSSRRREPPVQRPDRKSTRLNSSHSQISYAVFCLKKKKQLGPSPVPFNGPPNLGVLPHPGAVTTPYRV